MDMRPIQEAAEEVVAERMAQFIYDAYEDSAVEKGFAERRGNTWAEMPEGTPHRILLIDACKKFLRSEFVRYTEDVDTSENAMAPESVEPVVFQGGKNASNS